MAPLALAPLAPRRPLLPRPLLSLLSLLSLVSLLALLALLALAPSRVAAQACSLPGSLRVDCGYVGIGQAQCEQAGCCWSPLSVPGEDYPWCFYKSNDVCAGYNVAARTETATGFQLALNITQGSVLGGDEDAGRGGDGGEGGKEGRREGDAERG